MTETATKTADALPGGGYEDLPYVSLPITYSQPERLAAMAALHGLEAPAADAAGVLEIGCASGGNIVPLAARFPKARFLGIDLARRHIEIGRRRIAALGLGNIELREADICEARLHGQSFDYVICHGVWSWVPPGAREAILRVCRETLSPNGIAAISYNVLPGWHLRAVVRDIALMHAGNGTPRERVARVREILSQLASTGETTYGRLLTEEAQRLAQRPASYILGELLAESNDPIDIRTFAGMAAAQGLSYLCEADLGASVPALVAPQAADRIRALSRGDALAAQHYADIFTGRTFRRSLLVRSGRKARPPSRQGLSALHMACDVRKGGEGGGLADSRGRPLLARESDAQLREVLLRLGQRWPATLPVSELLDASEAAARAALETALMRLCASGRAVVSSLPSQLGSSDDACPEAWRVARMEAASGQPWVTSLVHTPVVLDLVLKVLLPMLDGRTERAVLAKRLQEAEATGLQQAGLSGAEPLSQLLELAARRALLVDQGTTKHSIGTG